jgi:hypothetical protein
MTIFDLNGNLIDVVEIVEDIAPPVGLSAQLDAAGYRPSVPAHITLETLAVDRKICRQAICGHCGRLGLEFSAWRKGPEYRVTGNCPEPGCDFEMEF